MALTPPVLGAEESLPAVSHEGKYSLSVCHVVGGGDWAGAEVQVATLLRGLSKFPQIALSAVLLHEGRFAEELRETGIDVYMADEKMKSFARVIYEASNFVKSRSVTILHSHGYKENIISLLLSRIARVPYVVRTEHGHPEPYSPIRALKHCCVLKADRWAAKHATDRIVAVSSDIAAYWKRLAAPAKVVALKNAVDVDRVMSALTPAEAKQRIGIAHNSFVIGVAARLEPIKRHDLFVGAAKYLAQKIPNSRFIIAGGGRQETSIRRWILASGLQDQVMLLGERNDVYDVLRAMDVLLICSDHEGIPMAMLEAMALEVPVVSRNVGGIPEVIKDGINGILVPSDDADAIGRSCMSLFENPDLRKSLASRAFNDVRQRYSADKNAKSMLCLYESLQSKPVAA